MVQNNALKRQKEEKLKEKQAAKEIREQKGVNVQTRKGEYHAKAID